MIHAPRVLAIDAATFTPHRLHTGDRDWPETNCYVDLWVELLHALECDPVAGLAFTLSTGFDGDQWEFFKFPPEDLRVLYGIEVREINVWRQLEDHIELHASAGNLLTVEVDSWFLPDTAGVSYRLEHQKTTIVPHVLDRDGQRLGYFHNGGYFQLTGDDYRGVLRVDTPGAGLAPYVELIDVRRMVALDPEELRVRARALARAHLQRRPGSNPVAALGERVQADLSWLRDHPHLFHAYAFGTLRQCGSWASMVAEHLHWLCAGSPAAAAATSFEHIASSAKACQFKLARVASGREVDLRELFAGMATAWDDGMAQLERGLGG